MLSALLGSLHRAQGNNTSDQLKLVLLRSCRGHGTMDKPTAAQQAYAAYAEVVGAAGTRLKAANTKVAESWAKNKPTTLIGWTAFCGACLLCLSALSTALTVLSGFLLSMAWIGVVLYSVLVAVSTAGAFIAGGAALFFSGTCAVMGTTILSCACTAYVCQALFTRLRAAVNTYMGTTRPTIVPAAVAAYNQQAKAAAPASPAQPAESSNSSTNAPAATTLPPASLLQLSDVAVKAAPAAVSPSRNSGNASSADAPAAWPPAVAANGSLGGSPNRKAAGKGAAVNAQLSQAIGVA